MPPSSVRGHCDADTVPVVVASDAAAQSDIYSAATLAGVLGGACIVLVGPRGEAMPADQQERLDAAAAGGYVVGGVVAVPDAKIAGRRMVRLGGADRWETALLVGREATHPGNTPPTMIPSADILEAVAAAVTIDAGWQHSCALRPELTIACWGFNSWSQADAPDGEFAAVALGDEHSCALRTDRTITCWGRNNHGQTDAPEGRFTAIDTTVGDHSCALRTDRTIACWGRNNHGQTVAPQGRFTAIAAGSGYSCALRVDRTIACWGLNSHGQTDTPRGSYGALSANGWHSCAVRSNRTVACWGLDNHDRTDAPAGQFNAVAAGGAHSCALRANRTVACWGANSWNDRPNGQSRPPAGEFLAISAGVSHTCGVRVDRTVACWGSDGSGQSSPPTGRFGPDPIAAPLTAASHAVRLPPQALRGPCSSDTVPVVVASDLAAQSDIYSAVTLAGVLGDACIVLAGPRGAPMPADAQARLDAAAAGGYVVGGAATVPESKLAGRVMKRLGGADRWGTALQVGQQASSARDAGGIPAESAVAPQR